MEKAKARLNLRLILQSITSRSQGGIDSYAFSKGKKKWYISVPDFDLLCIDQRNAKGVGKLSMFAYS